MSSSHWDKLSCCDPSASVIRNLIAFVLCSLIFQDLRTLIRYRSEDPSFLFDVIFKIDESVISSIQHYHSIGLSGPIIIQFLVDLQLHTAYPNSVQHLYRIDIGEQVLKHVNTLNWTMTDLPALRLKIKAIIIIFI